jgi:hypothetical protein
MERQLKSGTNADRGGSPGRERVLTGATDPQAKSPREGTTRIGEAYCPASPTSSALAVQFSTPNPNAGEVGASIRIEIPIQAGGGSDE